MKDEHYLGFKENLQKELKVEEKEDFLNLLNEFLSEKTEDFCSVPDGKKKLMKLIKEHKFEKEDFCGTDELNIWQYDAFLWL